MENSRFAKSGFPLLVKASWKMIVLEVWVFTFGESLVENACFGSLGLSLLVKVSGKMSGLEV